MNKTANYNLNQWEKSDRVLMEDFNADNAKIDTALNEKAEIAFGSYVGTGTYGAGNETVLRLGFQPRAVVVFGYATNSGDHMLMLNPCTSARSCDGNHTTCTVTWLEDGVQWSNYYFDLTQFNRSGQTYYYIAIK